MRETLQLWLAVVTVIGLIGGLVLTLHGQLRADLRQMGDEVRALRADVQDLGERVTRVEALLEGGARHQVGAGDANHRSGRRTAADAGVR